MEAGAGTDSMVRHGRALCSFLNARCLVDTADCPAQLSGLPCWETDGVPCCRHRDKADCCYCEVYLRYLSYRQRALRRQRSGWHD